MKLLRIFPCPWARGFAAAVLAMCACLGTVLAATTSTPTSLLLDAAFVSETQIVAVGERGSIYASSDAGRAWKPIASSARATLTGVSFAPASTAGWAVGHDALILSTTNSGQSWSRQYQAENLEDSFLDVLALDAKRVIAVGAYGLYVSTTDGGTTWTRRKLGDDDFHLNRLSRGPTGKLYLAGERGTLLTSADDGATWSKLAAPYEGSFYGVLPLAERTLLAYGLRGHVFRSTDDGETWTAIPTPLPILIATAARATDRRIYLAGQARSLFVSSDDGQSFVSAPQPPAMAVAELQPLPDGNVLAVGESGRLILQAAPAEARRP